MSWFNVAWSLNTALQALADQEDLQDNRNEDKQSSNKARVEDRSWKPCYDVSRSMCTKCMSVCTATETSQAHSELLLNMMETINIQSNHLCPLFVCVCALNAILTAALYWPACVAAPKCASIILLWSIITNMFWKYTVFSCLGTHHERYGWSGRLFEKMVLIWGNVT
jgi:hypothetical protein